MLMRLVGSVVELGLWVVVFLVVSLFIFFGLRGYNCYLSTTIQDVTCGGVDILY